MNLSTEKRPITLLFNPFTYIAGGQALSIGVAAILLAGLIGSLSNTHFDGVLDMHTGAAAPLWVFLCEGFINWLCLALVLLAVGRLTSKTSFRTIDLVGTQALARWPAVLLSLLVLPPGFQRFINSIVEQFRQGGTIQFDTGDTIVFFVIIVASIPVLCWMVYLMYKSYSVSCNLKGGKAIGTFIVGLIVAEIVSKLALVPLFAAGAVSPALPGSAPSTNVSTSMVSPADSDSVPTASTASDLNTAGTQFVDLLATEDFAAAVTRFDPTMKRVLPEQKLQELWQGLLKETGPFKQQLGTRRQQQMGFEVVFVTCQFERKVLDMKVVFDSKQQITGLFYVPSQGIPGAQAKGN